MKPETKREILIARAAFIRGMCYPNEGAIRKDYATDHARVLYPLPKITRPRVKVDTYGERWRVTGGKLEVWLTNNQKWEHLFYYKQHVITPERAAIFHDLFQNPTEEVEDDSE